MQMGEGTFLIKITFLWTVDLAYSLQQTQNYFLLDSAKGIVKFNLDLIDFSTAFQTGKHTGEGGRSAE